jgi:3-oxoacyl-[acyl-carrier protein] reductase
VQRLTDQVAIVTGGAQGVGRGIASVLSAEGARVVIADLQGGLAESTAAALRDGGSDALAVTTDVADRASVDAMVTLVIAEYGQGYGRIVLTSSITGPVTGQPGFAHYGASKAAMLGFMRSAAVELAVSGQLPGTSPLHPSPPARLR